MNAADNVAHQFGSCWVRRHGRRSQMQLHFFELGVAAAVRDAVGDAAIGFAELLPDDEPEPDAQLRRGASPHRGTL